jgi:hypothetical protein
MRQSSNDLALDGNGMCANFRVKRLTEADAIISVFVALRLGFSAPTEPKLHRIHEVETRRIHDNVLSQLQLGAEENRRAETRWNPLLILRY